MRDYDKYLLGSVSGYTKVTKQKLLDNIVSNKLIDESFEADMRGENAELNSIPIEQHLSNCLRESDRAIKFIEKYEFEKSYHYSIVMRAKKALNDSLVSKLRERGIIVEFDEKDTNKFDRLVTDAEEFAIATYIEDEMCYMFKLSSKIEQFSPEGISIYRKFPMLVVVHKDSNLVEIRYDSVKGILSTNVFYISKINHALRWIKNALELEIIETDAVLNRMNYIVSNKQELAERDEVLVIGQSMEFGNGSSAELYLGKSDSGILPFIGELKQFLLDYESEFDNSPVLKDAFESFLKEKEQDSNWPWVSLRKEFDNRKIEIKYVKDLYGLQVCRVLFYDNSKYDAGVMNDVIKYITEDSSNITTVAST